MVRSLHVPMDQDVFEYLRDDLNPPDYDWETCLIEAAELHKEQDQSDEAGAKSKAF